MFRDCKIDGEEVGTFTKYIYRTTVKRAKERLDALGYGINNFEKTFNNKMFQAIDYSAFYIIYMLIMTSMLKKQN